MIPKELIEEVEKFSFGESEKYKIPSLFQIKFANEIGQRLAAELKADKNIVLLGTLLMDCMLGSSYVENKTEQHISRAEVKTKEFLDRFPELTKGERSNIIQCVKEHHGSIKFSSLESEICCNADCYKFLSVKGLMGGIQKARDMSLGDLIQLNLKKVEEKWNALSLEICKKELEPQYKAIKSLLERYRD